MSGNNPTEEELYGERKLGQESEAVNVTRGDGSEFEYIRDSDVDCMSCLRTKMKVITETESTVMLMCPHCGDEHRIPREKRHNG